MFDSFLRLFTKNPLIFLASFIPKSITPNILTFFGLFFGIISCIFIIFNQNLIYALLIFWLSRLFDGLDGAFARKRGQQSDFGGYLDIIFDFIIYAIVPLSFAYVNPEILFWGMILEASFYVNSAGVLYLSGLLIKKRTGNDMKNQTNSLILPKGIIEAFETYIFYTLFYLLPDRIVSLFFPIF